MRNLNTIAGPLLLSVCATAVQATDLDFAMQPTPEQLRERADLIVTGPVQRVYVSHGQTEGGVTGYFVAQVSIRDVEKGEADDRAAVSGRYWARLRTDRRVDGCAPTSYDPLPREGDLVRAYLQKTPYGYQVVPPSGFEILERNSDPEPAVLFADAATPGDFRTAARAAAPQGNVVAARGPAVVSSRSWWIAAAACAVGALVGLPIGRATKASTHESTEA